MVTPVRTARIEPLIAPRLGLAVCVDLNCDRLPASAPDWAAVKFRTNARGCARAAKQGRAGSATARTRPMRRAAFLTVERRSLITRDVSPPTTHIERKPLHPHRLLKPQNPKGF